MADNDTEQTDENNGADHDASTMAAAAALLSPSQLDPAKPMWHLVAPQDMRDVVAILKTLPYERVHKVLPALMHAPLHQ